MKIRNYLSNRYILGAAVLLLSVVTQLAINTTTHAATLSQVLVRFDRMQISTATTGTVCATPATAATVASVVVGFPTGYALGAAATFTTSTTNLAWPSGAVAWPGITTASAVASQNVTFGSSTLTVGTLYCFNWTNSAAVTTPGTASANLNGTITTQTSAPAAIDTATFTTATISSDQIVVSATVPPSFSFALSANSDTLGTLNTSSVTASPTPRTATVNTNSKNGWTVWAYDTNVGLKSTSAGNYVIGSTSPGTNSTLTAGTSGYNMGVTSAQASGTGTIAVQAPFVGGSAGKGGGLNASQQAVATSNGSANNAVLTLTNNVAISSIVPAASDYTDTEYITGAGLF